MPVKRWNGTITCEDMIMSAQVTVHIPVYGPMDWFGIGTSEKMWDVTRDEFDTNVGKMMIDKYSVHGVGSDIYYIHHIKGNGPFTGNTEQG